MRKLLFVVAAVISLALLMIVPRDKDPRPTVVGQVAATQPSQPAVAAASQPAPTPPAESARLARLKSLTIDRRPSAVLAASAATYTPPTDPLERELDSFRRAAMFGDWAHVKTYLASLPPAEASAGYNHLLSVLQDAVPHSSSTAQSGEGASKLSPALLAERPVISVEDVIGLAAAAPNGQSGDRVTSFGTLVRGAIACGNLPTSIATRFRDEVAKPAGQAAFDRRTAAKILTVAGESALAGEFLPTLAEATKANDLEGLNLLAECHVARNRRDQTAFDLEQAWYATQAVLTAAKGDAKQSDRALLRAVELAPRVTDSLGRVWLEESFTRHPDRGIAILAKLGTLASTWIAVKITAPDDRKAILGLLKTATESLLRVAPERAKEWAPTLTILATAWLREAELARDHDVSTTAPRMQRDKYGNVYYLTEYNERGRAPAPPPPTNTPRPVPTNDVLKARPSDGWIALLGAPIQLRLLEVIARLHLKIDEEVEAFPLIERIAASQPDEARVLVKEFLRVWVKNHDMNAADSERRSAASFYGFSIKMDGIPLTRSKQERNLVDLAKWVERIRKLPGRAAELDGELVAKAFTATHSTAEVYKTEAIEQVFGPLNSLKPVVLANLSQQMRGNLSGVWQSPKVQTKMKTNRKPKDIEAEVLRGYTVARRMIDDSLRAYPNHYALLAARAALDHDEVNYRQELDKSSDFTTKRNEALNRFKAAADAYSNVVATLPEEEQGVGLYEQWFAASLGAVELKAVDEEKQPDWRQPQLIRASLAALPGELSTKHLARFATSLFTRISGTKPHIKFNYLKAGFAIVGDHPQANEAKKLFDYYKDLVTEIKLDAAIDGSPRVGHGQTFGLFVSIRHTREIERESGGFGRYLQNQASSSSYAYNYGRPVADYRDRFEKVARAALGDHFDVVSVTFQTDAVASRELPENGWRSTPYAYILLKARGPQVDAIPPLRLDLDFLDTAGYVVLPVESPRLPIECRSTSGEPRPLSNLSVTQTLDDRQSEKGVVRLEMKATGAGLIPDLTTLVGPLEISGFEVTNVEDQGLAVKKFDDEGDKVLSERAWLLTLAPKSTNAPLTTFHFPAMQMPAKETVYQKYADADLVKVESETSLGVIPRRGGWWKWAIAGVVGIAAVGGVVVLRRKRTQDSTNPEMPTAWTPFTVLQLLREVGASGALPSERRAELAKDTSTVEGYFFGPQPGSSASAPDLSAIAARWRAQIG